MSEKIFDCWKQVLFKPVLLFQQMQKGSGPFEFLGQHQIPASYSVVFPSLSRKQMQICPQIIYKDKHVCRNRKSKCFFLWLTQTFKCFCTGSRRHLPCEQWFLQAGRYGRETLSRSVRPGETTARRVEEILLHQCFQMQHICNISYSIFFSLWVVLSYFFFGWD